MKSKFEWSKFILALAVFSITLFSGCNQEKYSQGKLIYETKCANCHMQDGSGLGKNIPNLNKNLKTLSLDAQVCIIVNGKNAEWVGIRENVMPANKLTKVELTNLINYINSKWSNTKENTVKEIDTSLNNCNL